METKVNFTENKDMNCDGNKCFTLNGEESNTGIEFDNATYFLTHDNKILFDDGTPVECESDDVLIAIRNVLEENNITS